MTDDLAAIRARHVEHTHPLGSFCDYCEGRWPCDAEQALTAADEARKDAAEADYVLRATGDKLTAVREQRDQALAELAALRQGDGYYPLYARAVVERDHARETVRRVLALCDEVDERERRDLGGDDWPYGGLMSTDRIRAALTGSASSGDGPRYGLNASVTAQNPDPRVPGPPEPVTGHSAPRKDPA